VESSENIRERVLHLATARTATDPDLAAVLARRGLRFRATAVSDETAQVRIVALLRDRIANAPPSGAT
jgi:hypothetical protein